MTTVAVIGHGDMGREMLPHVLAAGYEARVHDADAERLTEAADAGAVAADSPADAARGADVILGLVMSDDIVAAYTGADGILAGAKPGSIVVICSTTTPQLVQKVLDEAPDGVTVVDAPIVGGVKYAREKAITFLLGADDTAAAAVEPVLEVFGKVRRVGDVGAGVDYKLITNIAIMAAEAGLREALDLADVLGRDYETSLDLMSVGPMAAVVERALDTTNPRPLRRSAEDDDTLLSAVEDPLETLPISSAGRRRLWEAVNADPDFEPDFVDLTRTTTSRPGARRG